MRLPVKGHLVSNRLRCLLVRTSIRAKVVNVTGEKEYNFSKLTSKKFRSHSSLPHQIVTTLMSNFPFRSLLQVIQLSFVF